MNRSGIGAGIVALALATSGGLVYGQAPAGQSGQSGGTTQRPSPAAQSGRSDSRSFINDMAVAGMAEVQLGKLAAERAENADVKEFGQMMVKDHSKANDELKQVASQLNVQPTTQLDKKHRDLEDRLSKLQGAEFDREYISAMVQGHQEVASKLRTRAGNRMTSNAPASGERSPGSGATAGSPGSQGGSSKPSTSGGQAVGTTGEQGEQALTQWATKTLPTVEQHLERARELQKKVAK
jgi:putative membrane protein